MRRARSTKREIEVLRLYYVYAIELRSVRGSRRDVYVGSSALPPEERLRRHRTSHRGSSRHVRDRGVRLLPHLYEKTNPLRTRTDAKREELRLRRRLETRGFVVYGACASSEERECWL